MFLVLCYDMIIILCQKNIEFIIFSMSGSASLLLPSPPRLSAAERGRILYVAPGSSLPLAIANAEQNNIEVLHLPPGEFNIGRHSFPNELIITGSGKDVTIINGTFTATRTNTVLILENLTLNGGEGIGITADYNIFIPTQEELANDIIIQIIDFEITLNNVKIANTNNGQAFLLTASKAVIHNITMNTIGECEFIVTGTVNDNIITYTTAKIEAGNNINQIAIDISGNLSIIYPIRKRCLFQHSDLSTTGTLYTKNVTIGYNTVTGVISKFIYDYDSNVDLGGVSPMATSNTSLLISVMYINKSGTPVTIIDFGVVNPNDNISIGKLYVNGSGFPGAIPAGINIGGFLRLN